MNGYHSIPILDWRYLVCASLVIILVILVGGCRYVTPPTDAEISELTELRRLATEAQARYEEAEATLVRLREEGASVETITAGIEILTKLARESDAASKLVTDLSASFDRRVETAEEQGAAPWEAIVAAITSLALAAYGVYRGETGGFYRAHHNARVVAEEHRTTSSPAM